MPGRAPTDAVELIARQLQARHGIPCSGCCGGGGLQQKTLDLRGAEGKPPREGTAAPWQAVPGEVVLFDDVFTTGATADTCARVLMAGGCGKVSVVSIAMEE